MSNAVIECLQSHRSIRKYKTDPIPEEVIQTLIISGTRGATSGNLQLYSFLVVDDPAKIDVFTEQMKPVIGRPPLIVIALVDLHRTKRWLEANDASDFVLDRPAYFFLGFCDAMIALQNLVVAAESLGLGTCYFGSILECDVQARFDVPELVFPASMVCLGYPDEEKEQSVRLPLEAVMHRNSYRSLNDADVQRLYRERVAVWERISEERKQALAKQGIHNIPQALAVQRFSEAVSRERSQGMLENLRRAGFTFDL